MDKHLTLQKRKAIIRQISEELEKLVDCFQINTSNFSILAIKVLERTKTHPGLTSANRYQISLDTLTRMANSLDVPDNEKAYLLSAIPSMIFDLSDLNQRGSKNKKKIKKDKKKKTKIVKRNPTVLSEGVFKIEEYVEEIYNKITKMILMEEIQPADMPSQVISLITDAIEVIETFVELRGIEKKQLVLRAFKKLSQNLEEIFPGITPEEIVLIQLALNTLPSLIDSVISVIEVKFDVNLDDVFTAGFWRKLCGCSKNQEA